MKIKPIIYVLLLSIAMVNSKNVFAQDCADGVPRTAPDNRYVDNENGSITDLATGLMWMQCSRNPGSGPCKGDFGKYLNWDEALQLGEILNSSGGYAGYADWRLPNVNELASLIEYSCSDHINTTYFNGIDITWSSTPSPLDALGYVGYAWAVDFNYGTTEIRQRGVNRAAVRLVRNF